MRSGPVDLGLVGFETKFVKLGLAVGRNSLYWAFQSHIKKKKLNAKAFNLFRPFRRRVFPCIGVS